MNNKYLIVLDTETSGLSPEKNEIIQLAAVAIDPRSLEIQKDKAFKTYIKPLKPEHWSDKAESVHGISLESLKDAIHPKVAWKDFCSFVNKYNPKGTTWTAPMPVGQNTQFDLNFINVLCKKYGPWDTKWDSPSLFNHNSLDIKQSIFFWCHDTGFVPNLKLDTFRDFVGLSKEGTHDALTDVLHTAEILVRFMKIHRYYAQKVKIKDSMKDMKI